MKSYKIQIIAVFGLILLLTFCVSTKLFNPTNRETEKKRNPITEDTNLQNSGLNDDNYEDNDEYWDAYDLTSYEDVWLSTIDGYGNQSDDDYYEISATAGDTLYVDCLFTHAEGDIDILLLDSVPNLLDYSASETDDEHIIYSVVNTGTYYILVTFGDAGNLYDLRWSTTGGGPIDDNYEENDVYTTAYNLTLYEYIWIHAIDGYGIQADDDWYEIYATAGDTIYIDCLFSHAEGDIDIELYDSGPFIVDSSGSVTDDEHIIYSVATTGTHYILVCYGDAGNQYDLRWYNSSTGSFDDKYEENDVYTTAYNLTLYEYTWLNKIKSFGIQADDDWYEIFVTSSELHLVVEFDFSYTEGYLNFSIYNSTGAYITEFNITIDDNTIDYWLSLNGTYYILVSGEDLSTIYNFKWYTDNAPQFPLLPGGGGGDDDGNGKDKEEPDIIEFLSSPIGLTIIGVSLTAAVIGIVIILKRSGKSRR